MSLFDDQADNIMQKSAPLASRMRPRTLDEIVGQDHILGKGKLLRKLIEADTLHSIILYGPPGTGKTTLANVIAASTKAYFEQLNASSAGVSELRRVSSEARERLGMYQRRTVLFIDEIHRFNKGQQDTLLPFVENGTIILIGATTETPTFEINPALVSRSHIFTLAPLDDAALHTIIQKALADPERGYGSRVIRLTSDAANSIVRASNGDARTTLNILEMAIILVDDGSPELEIVDTTIHEAVQHRLIQYDKSGEYHYDTISAFIKSMRGSDPDAAVYWLAKMLYAGEDPKFIARRMIIHAAEDVGMADPQALLVATAAAQALEYVGLPEARIPLTEAVIYIATAPKSNAVVNAIVQAAEDVRQRSDGRVPKHLKDSSYPTAKLFGHGDGYKYPHDYPYGYIHQQYLPDDLKERIYYVPTEHGYEKTILERLKKMKETVKNYPKEN
jgi:putative ATPase